MYGEGISREGDILDLAANENIVDKSGAWFSYKGERLGQGRDSVKQLLKENPVMAEEIRAAVLSKHKVKTALVDKANEELPAVASAKAEKKAEAKK